MARSASARLQSPDVAAKTADAFRQQAAMITEQSPELSRFFALGGEENLQAHHKAILQTIGLAFENLENDPAGAARLRQHANDRGYAIGNSIMNLMPTPQGIHQGGIHDFALQQGYQLKTGPGKGYEQQGPLVQRLMDASTGTIEDRMGALDAYFSEAMPALTDHLDDLLTDYYGRQDARAKAKNFIETNDNSERKQSHGDNENHPMVINSGGGDVIIGDAAAKEIRQSHVAAVKANAKKKAKEKLGFS